MNCWVLCWVLWYSAMGESLDQRQEDLTLLMDAPSLTGICRRVHGATRLEVWLGPAMLRQWPDPLAAEWERA